MADNLQELIEKVSELEKLKPFTIKEGEIIYIYHEVVSDKFTKIDVGLDCSELSPSGKIINDYISFQISDRQKELFPLFDPNNPNPKYKKGFRVKVMLEISSYQTSIDKKNNNRTIIYNNVSLCRETLIKKANAVQEGEEQTAPPVPPVVDDDIPF
jgi:hypothetical protein